MAPSKPRHTHFDLRGSHHYLTPGQRVPGYLPYKSPVSPGDIPVPNEAGMFWPQGQFAPKFFPAGHRSFTPFEFPSNSEMEESAQLILKNDEREYGDPTAQSTDEDESWLDTERTFSRSDILLYVVGAAMFGYILYPYLHERK